MKSKIFEQKVKQLTKKILKEMEDSQLQQGPTEPSGPQVEETNPIVSVKNTLQGLVKNKGGKVNFSGEFADEKRDIYTSNAFITFPNGNEITLMMNYVRGGYEFDYSVNDKDDKIFKGDNEPKMIKFLKYLFEKISVTDF